MASFHSFSSIFFNFLQNQQPKESFLLILHVIIFSSKDKKSECTFLQT